MELSQQVRLLPADDLTSHDPEQPIYRSATYARLASRLRRAIARSRDWLLAEQHSDGYWCAELEGDTILESEYILLLAWLGRHDSEIARKCAQRIVDQQAPSGGWSMYPGGRVEISGSVKAYFALKLTGHDPAAEYMQRARAAILAHGGADAVNSFTRFYLALLGQISYEHCPSVPTELMLLPRWFPINIYAMSSWSRTIVVPLAIMAAYQPVVQLDPALGIRELFLKSPEAWGPLRAPGVRGSTGLLSWDRFFRLSDRVLKFLERHGLMPLRQRSIEMARQWMVARFRGSDGLGAIFPPMVWSVIALRCLGYDDESPELRYCYERLDGLILQDEESARLQPCKSPVWDTAITLRALADSGVPADHAAVERAVDWLLRNQIRKPGDWSQTVAAEAGGWCFEFENDYYPDLDDTAMVVMALANQFMVSAADTLPPGFRLLDFNPAEDDSRTEGHHRAEGLTAAQRSSLLRQLPEAIARAEQWMLAMQNSDGGWGAFDRNNDSEFLCYVPFADHNAMIDPSTPDLAARVLEALGKLGHRVGEPAIDRSVAYLRSTQEADGSWFGRWGVNYIYGTWQVLTGLRDVGVPVDDPAIVAGANWLVSYQQAAGGWGESADSYEDSSLKGQGTMTASQTAWAILGLLAAGWHEHPAVARGVRWLMSQQQADGTWDEPEFTGTGFPQVFYLRYHYYRIYFPLMALGRWAVAIAEQLQDEVPATVPMSEVMNDKL